MSQFNSKAYGLAVQIWPSDYSSSLDFRSWHKSGPSVQILEATKFRICCRQADDVGIPTFASFNHVYTLLVFVTVIFSET